MLQPMVSRNPTRPHERMANAHWYTDVVKHMLSEDALAPILVHMYHTIDRMGPSTDPITHTARILLSEPIHFVLHETGASFFQNHTACVYPFRRMTPAQRETIRRCVARRDEWNILTSRIVFKPNPDATRPYRLDPVVGMQAICRTIVESAPADKSMTICNAVLQQTQADTPLSHPTHRALNEWLERFQSKTVLMNTEA